LNREQQINRAGLVAVAVTVFLFFVMLRKPAKSTQSTYVKLKLAQLASDQPQSLPRHRMPKQVKLKEGPLKLTWVLLTVGTQCKESVEEWACKPRTIRLGLQEGGAVLWK
jgi:hypothetical protein